MPKKETKAELAARAQQAADNRARRKAELSLPLEEKEAKAKESMLKEVDGFLAATAARMAELDGRIANDFANSFEWGYVGDRYELDVTHRTLRAIRAELDGVDTAAGGPSLEGYPEEISRQLAEELFRTDIKPRSSGQFKNIAVQLEFTATQDMRRWFTSYDLTRAARDVFGSPKSALDTELLAEIAAERHTMSGDIVE
jgi:hypothetical protein